MLQCPRLFLHCSRIRRWAAEVFLDDPLPPAAMWGPATGSRKRRVRQCLIETPTQELHLPPSQSDITGSVFARGTLLTFYPAPCQHREGSCCISQRCVCTSQRVRPAPVSGPPLQSRTWGRCTLECPEPEHSPAPVERVTSCMCQHTHTHVVNDRARTNRQWSDSRIPRPEGGRLQRPCPATCCTCRCSGTAAMRGRRHGLVVKGVRSCVCKAQSRRSDDH